ncbi:MAG: PaaI family thioesterase [Myxococcota bacterium]
MRFDDVLRMLDNSGGLAPSLNLTLEQEENGVVGTLPLGPMHAGAPGIAHGGALMVLLDSVLGARALMHALPKGRATSTVEMKVNFLRPAPLGRTLVARADVQSAGNSLIVVTGTARDAETEEPVAFAVGTFNLYVPKGLAAT